MQNMEEILSDKNKDLHFIAESENQQEKENITKDL